MANLNTQDLEATAGYERDKVVLLQVLSIAFDPPAPSRSVTAAQKAGMPAARELAALPEDPPNLAGESIITSGRSSIKVSNAQGYLCHVTSVGDYDCAPAFMFGLFTNPGQ